MLHEINRRYVITNLLIWIAGVLENLKPGKTLIADELIAYCRRSLANFKVPRSIEFSQTELPKSGSGKMLKSLLRDAAWVRQERAVA